MSSGISQAGKEKGMMQQDCQIKRGEWQQECDHAITVWNQVIDEQQQQGQQESEAGNGHEESCLCLVGFAFYLRPYARVGNVHSQCEKHTDHDGSQQQSNIEELTNKQFQKKQTEDNL